MNKKIIPLLASAAFLAITTSVTVFAIGYNDNSAANKAAIVPDFTEFNDKKSVEKQGARMAGSYERKLAELDGIISSDAPRIKYTDVQEMISSGKSYSEIEAELYRLQPYPDFVGGSGVTNIDFWCDDNGVEIISLLHEQKEISYIQCEQDGANAYCQTLLTESGELK